MYTRIQQEGSVKALCPSGRNINASRRIFMMLPSEFHSSQAQLTLGFGVSKAQVQS